MKLELNCNYFINLTVFDSLYRIARMFILSMLIGLFFFCGSDRKRQNDIKRDECIRLSYLAYSQSTSSIAFSDAEKQILNYQLSYSCSAESGQSPSCLEYYFSNPEAKRVSSICSPSYRKTASSCSQQNAIGSCIIFQEDGYEKTNYAKPNDDPQQSQIDCSARKGRYQSIDSTNLLAGLLANCELVQE